MNKIFGKKNIVGYAFILFIVMGGTVDDVLGQQTGKVQLSTGERDIILDDKKRGTFSWKAEIINVTEVLSSRTNAYNFSGQSKAELQLRINVNFKRPTRRDADKRVILRFDEMDDNNWSRTGGNKIEFKAEGTYILQFTTNQNGPIHFILPFAFSDTLHLDKSEWNHIPPQDNSIILPEVIISGLMSEDEKFWRKNEIDFIGWATYLRQYPSGQYKSSAIRKIAKKLEGLYLGQVKEAKTLPSLDKLRADYAEYDDIPVVAEFINKVNSKRKKIQEGINKREATPPTPTPKPLTPSELERTAFQKAKVSGDTTSILDYLSKYAHENALYFEEATDSLISWRPTYYTVRLEEGGWRRIELFNFKEPAYYDIYGGIMEIQSSAGGQSNTFRVKPSRQGELNIKFVDRVFPHKSESISFSNLMDARMEFDTIRDVYLFQFKEGVKPYRLVLVEPGSRQVKWDQGDITQNQLMVSTSELREAGLTGALLALVYSEGARQPLKVIGGNLLIPGNNGLPKGLLITLLILLTGLGLLLFLLLRNRKKRSPTIFDQT